MEQCKVCDRPIEMDPIWGVLVHTEPGEYDHPAHGIQNFDLGEDPDPESVSEKEPEAR